MEGQDMNGRKIGGTDGQPGIRRSDGTDVATNSSVEDVLRRDERAAQRFEATVNLALGNYFSGISSRL
jgi:hypothetical protein